MSKLFAKTSSQSYAGKGNEVILEPSGKLVSFGSLALPYPKFIRNGFFKAAQNSWSNPVTSGIASSQHVFDGWHVKQNNGCSVNAARTDNLGGDGWPSRYSVALNVTAIGSGNDDFVILEQRVFDVTQFSGKVVTMDFEAKSDFGRKIAVEFVSDEGNGNAPITKAGIFDLNAEIKTFTARASLPALSGNALGSLSKLIMRVWIVAGADYDERLGTHISTGTGTVDFSGFRDRSLSYEPSAQEELDQARQYFVDITETHYMSMFGVIMGVGGQATNNAVSTKITWPVNLAYDPLAAAITLTNSFFTGSPSIITPNVYGATISGVASDNASVARITKIEIDIELPV